ncbi:MAG: TetR/AcrR family transcriptional regulator [Rudaea sp.]|nr:TetR/AcrR family transcriptional regulator [Rudaea sp.]
MDSEKSPQQERSRATAQRLLSATIRVISESGLDAATVPKIAALAKVAPASVYRRYQDKDALIRAAFLHALEQSNVNNRLHLKRALLKQTLESTAVQLMKLLFEQYRQHPLLIRSLSRYLDSTDDRDFARRARSVMAANVEEVVAVLLHHRDEIVQADPECALRFALLNATCSIEAYAFDPNSLWHSFRAFSPDFLATELAAGFVAYLSNAAKPPRSKRSKPRR